MASYGTGEGQIATVADRIVDALVEHYPGRAISPGERFRHPDPERPPRRSGVDRVRAVLPSSGFHGNCVPDERRGP